MEAIGGWIFTTICIVFAVAMLAGVFMPDSWVERWKRHRWLSRDPHARAVMWAAQKLKK
jgi:hypothetical protein